jgi:uncharacterized membrane protein
MDMQTNRLLGIIGAFLMVIGFFPVLGGMMGIFTLVGIIFVLIALKGYGDSYKDGTIFRNAVYTVIFEIIGVVVFIAVIAVAAVGFLASLGIKNLADFRALQNINWQSMINFNNLLPFIGVILLAILILFVFSVLASWYFKKAMATLSAKTGVKLFHTTGTLFFVGAILTVILVGFILIWVSLILLAISFYEIKPEGQMQQPISPPQP